MNKKDWKDLKGAFERHIDSFVYEARVMGVEWDILDKLEAGMLETRLLLERNGCESK
jgi:hypothetical protein